MIPTSKTTYIAMCLIMFRGHLNIVYIVKVEILMDIKWPLQHEIITITLESTLIHPRKELRNRILGKSNGNTIHTWPTEMRCQELAETRTQMVQGGWDQTLSTSQWECGPYLYHCFWETRSPSLVWKCLCVSAWKEEAEDLVNVVAFPNLQMSRVIVS